jgi:hypothetical protein
VPGPANLYGVANNVPLWVFAAPIGGADVACPAGVETNCIAAVVNPIISPGTYYAAAIGAITVTLGATVPTACAFGLKIGAGSDVIQVAPSTALFVASGTFVFPIPLYGINTLVQNPVGPTTFNVTCFPTAQPVTVKLGGSFVFAGWVRGPDQ